MNKINKKARIQFFLLVTDYVINDNRYTDEQKIEMINFRDECRAWQEGKQFPSFPSWFPYPDLYDVIFGDHK